MITNNETNTNSERDAMLAGLRAFVRQRPGFDFNNYGDVASYRQDVRRAGKQLSDAETLLAQVQWRSITAEDLKRAAINRLTWESGKWEYVAGQYWCTEYRAAACSVLASVLWSYCAKGSPQSDGKAIRKQMRKEYGRGLASRWFN